MSSSSRAWPCAVSTTRTSTPASRRALARSQASPKKPTAAPTSRRPSAALLASGYCSDFTKSLTVMRPRRWPSSSTIGRRSRLWARSRADASSRLMPSGPVMSGIGVMISPTVRVPHSATGTKRRSRLVMMPSSLSSWSTTGRPETRYSPHVSSSSSRVALGWMVTGLGIMPVWVRLTRSTWYAWSSIERLRCRMPMPPSRAIAMAMRASVTVSMALERSGIRRSRLAGEAGRGVDLARDDVGLARQQQDVVVGEPQGGELVGNARLLHAPMLPGWLHATSGRREACCVGRHTGPSARTASRGWRRRGGRSRSVGGPPAGSRPKCSRTATRAWETTSTSSFGRRGAPGRPSRRRPICVGPARGQRSIRARTISGVPSAPAGSAARCAGRR